MGKVIHYITDSKGKLSSRRKLSPVEIHDTLTRNSVFWSEKKRLVLDGNISPVTWTTAW